MPNKIIQLSDMNVQKTKTQDKPTTLFAGGGLSTIMVIFFVFLGLSLVSFSPAYGGPKTRGQNPDTLVGVEGEQEEEDTDKTDANVVEMATDEKFVPVRMGEVNASAQEAATLRKKSGFDVFNALYSNQWAATFNTKTGKIRVLLGALSKEYGNNDPENTALSFLGESTTIFGLQQDLSDLKTARVDVTPERDHVRFQQTYNGVPVFGAFVIVHANKKGQVTMVQNGHAGKIQTINSDMITAAVAVEIARNDLKASLNEETLLRDGKNEKLLYPQDGKYLYVWQITFPTEEPFGFWVYRVDAESGRILYKADEIMSLQSGSGTIYKSNADWHAKKVSTGALKNLYATGDGYNHAGGYLWGLFASVDDNYGNNPFSSTYKFLYDPVGQPDFFNATQAYYATNTIRDWWTKTVIAKYGPDLNGSSFYDSIPVITNYNDCNAFYSPDLNGMGPGMAFGAENQCAPGSANWIQDWDVVRHEYTHAMMDWSGFNDQFGGPADWYGRAMGEGNADWFAFLPNTKDPFFGDVAWSWSKQKHLRNLNNTSMYPRAVDDPATGLPEEHYTGQIWGGYLYDLYKNIGSKALTYVYQSFFYFDPVGGFHTLYPDFFDAIYAQRYAEYDLTGKYTNTLKAWGSMASRGLNAYLRDPYESNNYFNSNSRGRDNAAYFSWDFPPFKKISTKGTILDSNDKHEYLINTVKKGLLTVTVTAKTGGALNPSIVLYNTAKVPVPSLISATTTNAVLTRSELPKGFYIIQVTGKTSSTTGRGDYDIKVTFKESATISSTYVGTYYLYFYSTVCDGGYAGWEEGTATVELDEVRNTVTGTITTNYTDSYCITEPKNRTGHLKGTILSRNDYRDGIDFTQIEISGLVFPSYFTYTDMFNIYVEANNVLFSLDATKQE